MNCTSYDELMGRLRTAAASTGDSGLSRDILALNDLLAASGFSPDQEIEGECNCSLYPDGVTCRECKLASICDGCGDKVMFESLATGELLCPICAAMDAGEHIPPTPVEDRIVETLVRWLSAPRRLFDWLGLLAREIDR